MEAGASDSLLGNRVCPATSLKSNCNIKRYITFLEYEKLPDCQGRKEAGQHIGEKAVKLSSKTLTFSFFPQSPFWMLLEPLASFLS